MYVIDLANFVVSITHADVDKLQISMLAKQRVNADSAGKEVGGNTNGPLSDHAWPTVTVASSAERLRSSMSALFSKAIRQPCAALDTVSLSANS